MTAGSSARRWYDMSDREHAIWAAVFSRTFETSSDVLHCALIADRAVSAWRDAQADESIEAPEIEAARRQIALTREEFAAWYPVAHRMAFGRAAGYRPPSVGDIDLAYMWFDRSRTDFF